MINKTYAALNSNGIFAFSLKQGYGSVWTNEKLDAPRFYQYWQPEEIEQLLTEQGFELLDILEGPTSQRNAGWLYIIARKVTS